MQLTDAQVIRIIVAYNIMRDNPNIPMTHDQACRIYDKYEEAASNCAMNGLKCTKEALIMDSKVYAALGSAQPEADLFSVVNKALKS
jgi:hypothetical protein